MSKSDHNRQTDEEFPSLCETCLGPPGAPIRMNKISDSRACKICERGYCVFRWRPGPNARFKSTIICRSCARIKNVCQTCLFDLTYNLPVQVRDSVLAAEERVTLAKDDKTRHKQIVHLEAKLAVGDESALSVYQKPNATLERMSRKSTNYDRNRAKPCSFFARGACTRGDMCPYRHEIVEVNELSKQNIKDRYFGVNDPVANKILRNSANKIKSIPNPEDQTITTLWISGFSPETTEQDIRSVFMPYGEISSIRLISEKACAFVTYFRRGSAEEAALKLFSNLSINHQSCRLSWARQPDSNKKPEVTEFVPLPPPGIIDSTQYSSMQPDFVPEVMNKPPGL